MEWTVRFFAHQHDIWQRCEDTANVLDTMAYASRKAAMWQALAINADKTFANINHAYSIPDDVFQYQH